MPNWQSLLLLVIIHVIIFIIILSLYLLSLSRVNQSLRGPGPEISVEEPKRLKLSLHLLFLLALSLEFSNLLTHGIPLLFDFQDHPGYYFIGGKDIFMLTSIPIMVLMLFKLRREIKDEQDQMSDLIVPVLWFTAGIIVLIIRNLQIPRIYMVYLLIPVLLNVFGIFIYQLTSTSMVLDNPVLQLRKNIVDFALYSVLIYITFSILIYSPLGPNERLENWNDMVHIYVLTKEILAITIAISLFCLIVLPKWVRDFVGISNEKYDEYADYRFDYGWENVVRGIDSVVTENEFSLKKSKWIINKNTTTIANSYVESEKDILHLEQVYESEYLRQYILPRSHFVLLSIGLSDFFESQLNYLNDRFRKKFSIENSKEIIVSNNFLINFEDQNLVLICTYPSIYNSRFRTLLIYCEERLLDIFEEYLETYQNYYESMVKGAVSVHLVRFKEHNGEFINVPPAFPNSGIPDQDYILEVSS